MFRNILFGFMITTLAVPMAACDRQPDPPGQAEQRKKDDEGNAWRGLMQGLDTASNDEAKLRLLNRFIENNPDHPDVADAKRRIEAIENNPDAVAKEKLASTVQSAVEEGQLPALLALLASDAVRQASDRYQRDPLSKPITVPTSDGTVAVTNSLFLHPLVIRGNVRRALMQHAKDKLEERCGRQCVNETISGFLSNSVGGALFLEDGKMNPDAVGPALEKAWLDPDADVLGVPARSWYAVFKPTFRAYIQVGQAIQGANPATGATTLRGLSTPGEVAEFYTTWTDAAQVAKKTGLPPADARAITGWWLRRHADGTAALFETHAQKIVEGYDPELTPPE